MRSLRLPAAVAAASLVVSLAVVNGQLAFAQSVSDAEEDAAGARERAEVATGLVDEAVANRAEIEKQLAETISRVNDLSAKLSILGAALDRTASQLGFADVELAGIQSAIEVQAVDAYMTVLASPTFSLVNSSSVEKALVASSVVEDVVGAGRAKVDELFIKRRDLEELQQQYLAREEEFQVLQDEINAEVEHLAELYDEADASVAKAVRQTQSADAEYQAALSAVELARDREEERRRQEERKATTTTTPAQPTSTTTPSNTTTTTSGGGGGPWNHPPAVEQWRPLVGQFFPANRVEEALRIIDCESNGDPNAYNPYSGASGLFQFIPSTWATASPRAGYPGASPFEPEANTASAAWLANRYEQLGLYYWLAWSCRRVLN